MSRYSPASRSRVQAEPRSGSSAHCTSSRTSTSPELGAISTVQQMIGAVVVDALLARDEADRVLAELGREAAVRLLREHPQRPGVDAAAPLLQELERVVGLARVGRAEVRDDGSPAATAAAAARSRSRPRRGARPRACPQRAPAGGAPSGSGASPGRVPVCVRRACVR